MKRTSSSMHLPRVVIMVLLIAAAVSLPGREARATPEYSARSGQGCLVCHRDAAGGGALSENGLEFAAAGYTWPPSGGYRVLGPIRKPIRLLVGYLHVLSAFIWFGTILYVHILLRPAYASKGLPRGEKLMGLASMATVGITGVLLTISRVRGFDVLIHSPWGITLSVKILLYVVMLSSAIFVVRFIGPRLGRKDTALVVPGDGRFDPVTLSAFDGKDGRPAYVAVGDQVLDVTNFRLWKGGLHMKHPAGTDLTDALGRAPHSREKLDPAPMVGSFDPNRKPPLTSLQKAFYAIAYLNLGLVFVVLLVIAYWRWGL